MKKLTYLLMAAMLVMALAGCSKSNISIKENGDEKATEQTSQQVAETPIATVEYVIPEGAKGPSDGIINGDKYASYPDDKKPKDTENMIQVSYFYITGSGLNEDVDVIYEPECTAENLTALLIKDGTLATTTVLVSFTDNGDGTAVIEFNELTGAYEKATEDQLAQAVANTICDNLAIDMVTVKAGSDSFGPLEYNY
ncbi:MAG: GerMN domain-containing protein [Eubacteriales bacterium]|nr:GerMN domain-containing protein [Eubacteriales bacterium]